MWNYEKKLQFPINIKKKDLRMAKNIITQLGGPDGELRAAIRYLQQRFTMPTPEAKALLTDIGTEELAHVEMIDTILYQLMKDATINELKDAGLDGMYTEHKKGIFPTDANGYVLSLYGVGIKGDWKVDLTEDIAAEEKARATYEALMDLTDDPDILGPLSFLRKREIVHFKRFSEMLTKLNNELK